MVYTRRMTIDIDDNDEPAMPSQKKMTAIHEDVFISVVLNFFDVIENKSTDKSLNPKALRDRQSEAWAAIRAALAEKTSVSFLHLDKNAS